MEPILVENINNDNVVNPQFIIDTEKLKLYLEKHDKKLDQYLFYNKCNNSNSNSNNNNNNSQIESQILEYRTIEKKFKKYGGFIKTYHQFHSLTERLVTESQLEISKLNFIALWSKYLANKDGDTILFNLLVANSNQQWLDFSSLVPLVQTLIDYHPGLKQLHSVAKKYQSHYIDVLSHSETFSGTYSRISTNTECHRFTSGSAYSIPTTMDSSASLNWNAFSRRYKNKCQEMTNRQCLEILFVKCMVIT
ncbi:hypothetical protein PPL_03878 [Heterostelium album PN500]|uniref:PP2A regulatory subunit B'' EF-hand domain-containing protein n=1 Tax=Heterostelium pallidum (strain ATCC 26659 / Pp 5 / PN500) TaxID=670386 RepID=D3B5E0_HETP5|nr:hypothetical protein PPL_03878 [Heterostelium album PN500]EFA83088.1 hypothetical protein PPL_03878 [Heterostelium album PN500]|eukprot:XP_020435205.1 hypothetical protein PPL_03878 [Heterostelium album PN500]